MRLARPRRNRDSLRVESEPIFFRQEAVGLMFAVADILVEVRRIRALLEDDGEEEDLEE